MNTVLVHVESESVISYRINNASNWTEKKILLQQIELYDTKYDNWIIY